MPRAVSLTLNGKPVRLETDGARTLLWVLRTDLGLTGAKYGCGIGLCGSCTVVVGDKAVRSCRLPLAQVEGQRVTTIEGLARDGALHPLQQAFIDKGGFQCGYCTPGMVMVAKALLDHTAAPDEAQIAEALSGNICRCTGYRPIVRAVEFAAEAMSGDEGTQGR
jgi:aerobic-type carbon monoxide dehydrogenase small subunit (CoxS/CutS family)